MASPKAPLTALPTPSVPDPLPLVIADLIDRAGSRTEAAAELKLNFRTFAKRLQDPSTFTVGELRLLAGYVKQELLTLAKMADEQAQRGVVPAPPRRGRQAAQH